MVYLSNYPEPSGIKTWAEEDRPREKLLLKGKHSLTESELIAILLRTGTRERTAVDVAMELMKNSGNDLNALSKLTVKDILALGINGIGETKAITIVAALELGRRRQTTEAREKDKISSSKDCYDVLQPLIADVKHEEFWILMLNRANKVIAVERMSEGGLTGTVADPRKIFNSAIKSDATSVILCHNHPSGNLTPSSTDIELTKKMKEAGKILEISVLDHLIIGENKYYSFADEGMM
ncbi:MAG: DNA repair protein RadC [Chitinophagales bacterium]|jgi:DNA repair protein RadC|nr:DNA repair protein RadC [Chitinophagales bacterium]